MTEASEIKAELSAWFDEATSKHIDSLFAITVEKQEGRPPLTTVTCIPNGGFTKEQVDTVMFHLEAIADVLRERREKGRDLDWSR
jgi:hypothetical protein